MPKGIEHKPNEESRAQVAALYSFGHTQEEIAAYLNICVETLVRHYDHQLRTARIETNSMVAKRLYNKAVNQDDLAAQIFWLKTRARWRTTDPENGNQDNDRIKRELEDLRREMDEKNRKDY